MTDIAVNEQGIAAVLDGSEPRPPSISSQKIFSGRSDGASLVLINGPLNECAIRADSLVDLPVLDQNRRSGVKFKFY